MTQLSSVGKVGTRIYTENGFTVIRYHSTDVVKFNQHEIVLNHGGWQTNTTKNRMNQTSNQFDLGFSVFQNDYAWYVSFKGKTIEFNEQKITLTR